VTLAFISLFAGIGGFDLGFERAGMYCVLQVEKDQNCRTVLKHHWSNVDRWGTVETFGKAIYRESVDLICGGFPCQDLSVAGRREGLAGERSGLWFAFLRIIEELKPEWVVIENVPGLLSSNGGRDLAIILSGLENCGYWWAYRTLDAQFFGVPQRRRRVFVIGCLTKGCAQQVLFEREGSPWDIAPGREAGERIAAPLTKGSATGNGVNAPGRRREDDVNLVESAFCFEPRYARNGRGAPKAICNHCGFETVIPDEWDECPCCLKCSDWRVVVPPLKAQSGQTGKGDGAPLVFEPRYYTRDNKTGGKPSGCADITNAYKAGDSAPVVFQEAQYGVAAYQEAGALRAERIPEHQMLLQRYGVRRLTPLECERLQGLPDDWTNVNGMSDSARYRC
jgi:DNA (cytosine-5)-methyltransferase 1